MSVDLKKATSPIIVLLMRLAHLLERLVLVQAAIDNATPIRYILSLRQELLAVNLRLLVRRSR